MSHSCAGLPPDVTSSFLHLEADASDGSANSDEFNDAKDFSSDEFNDADDQPHRAFEADAREKEYADFDEVLSNQTNIDTEGTSNVSMGGTRGSYVGQKGGLKGGGKGGTKGKPRTCKHNHTSGSVRFNFSKSPYFPASEYYERCDDQVTPSMS